MKDVAYFISSCLDEDESERLGPDLLDRYFELLRGALERSSKTLDFAALEEDWRALYPINGTRSHLVPPPGWRAPKDWADYPIPLAKLQDKAAPGMPPPGVEKILDLQHGERGRLVYDCETKWYLGGLCRKNKPAKEK